MQDDTLGAYNIADLRELARRRLPKGIFEVVDRGTEDEVSLRNNRAAFERIKLKPRVLVDRGFRRGSDVIKALALGANAVLIGRSSLYGAAAAGEAGAARAITIFRDEIDHVLALLGCPDVAALNADYLVRNNLRRAPSLSS